MVQLGRDDRQDPKRQDPKRQDPGRQKLGIIVATWLLAASISVAARAESLQEYAALCEAATGTTVPDFDCDAGTEVPVTHLTAAAGTHPDMCDEPNRLNHECDPGSRFQVLTNTSSGYVVAHCRKQHNAAGMYGDIAVIQYGRKTGATCFYQALGSLLGGKSAAVLSASDDKPVKAPAKGQPAWQWKLPVDTADIHCARCHDSGPLVRSAYINAVAGANAIPGKDDPSFNRDQPYSFVGVEGAGFATWKTFKVEVAGNQCVSCHRLGVNNLTGEGTARVFALEAVDLISMATKNPPSAASPHWMPPYWQPPGSPNDDKPAQDDAQAIHDCGMKYTPNAPLPDTDACRITPLASAYIPCPKSYIPGKGWIALCLKPHIGPIYGPGGWYHPPNGVILPPGGIHP